MPTMEDIKSWRGQGARGSDGDKIGKVEDIHLDRETGRPERGAGPARGSGTRGYGF
jgi:sporulation protein YlmC with PRC-barrel domain